MGKRCHLKTIDCYQTKSMVKPLWFSMLLEVSSTDLLAASNDMAGVRPRSIISSTVDQFGAPPGFVISLKFLFPTFDNLYLLMTKWRSRR